MSVQGKAILVTGAGQGIGRGIALRLAKDGANLALVDIKPDFLLAVREEVESLGCKATTFVADVSQREQVHAAYHRKLKRMASGESE